MTSNKRRNTLTWLVGLYVGLQLIADVGATRMVDVWGYIIPGGTFVFAATFTLRDLLHKRFGASVTYAAILVAVVANALLALYTWGIGSMAAPVWFDAEAWGNYFVWLPSITVASILAEFVSQFVDTLVYQLFVGKVTHKYQWARVVVTNAVSLPLDSVVFSIAAFTVLPMIFGGDILPINVALQLGVGQIIFKAIVAVVSIPTIYLVRDNPEVLYE